MQLEVEGDPVPKIEWFKGFKDLSMEGGRFKSWTDGTKNQAVLGIENIKQEDEGAYKCVLNGTVEHEFSVYVTGELTNNTLLNVGPTMKAPAYF